VKNTDARDELIYAGLIFVGLLLIVGLSGCQGCRTPQKVIQPPYRGAVVKRLPHNCEDPVLIERGRYSDFYKCHIFGFLPIIVRRGNCLEITSEPIGLDRDGLWDMELICEKTREGHYDETYDVNYNPGDDDDDNDFLWRN